MAMRRTYPIVAAGVGRVDYSKNAEIMVETAIRSHLSRRSWVGYWEDVPSSIYPDTNASLFLFFADSTLQFAAPSITQHIKDISFSTNRNCLVYAKFAKYATFWDMIDDETHIGPGPEEVIWEEWGYGGVELKFSKGIPTEEGHYYAIQLAAYSEKPTYTYNIQIHGLADLIEGALP